MKRILQNFCPKCRAFIAGEQEGEQTILTCQLRGEVTHTLFRMSCPNCQRQLTLLNASYMTQPVLWDRADEDILDTYCVRANKRNKAIPVVCFYLYTPSLSYNTVQKLSDEIERWSKQGRYITTVSTHAESMILPSSIEDRIFRKWILPKRFFTLSQGNIYPSLIAEMNIVSEKARWADMKLVSFYPTAMPDFEVVGFDNPDWDELEAIASV